MWHRHSCLCLRVPPCTSGTQKLCAQNAFSTELQSRAAGRMKVARHGPAATLSLRRGARASAGKAEAEHKVPLSGTDGKNIDRPRRSPAVRRLPMPFPVAIHDIEFFHPQAPEARNELAQGEASECEAGTLGK
jgi:hypothetical protein